MLIYRLPNIVQGVYFYVCDSQETIDNRPKNPDTGEYTIPADLCSVGDKSQADAMLATFQQQWLVQQTSLFTVNLQTTVKGGVVWTVVDLSTEPANTDKQYFIFDPTNGLYEPATGLDAAKALLEQVKQKYVVFSGMGSYITMNTWE